MEFKTYCQDHTTAQILGKHMSPLRITELGYEKIIWQCTTDYMLIWLRQELKGMRPQIPYLWNWAHLIWTQMQYLDIRAIFRDEKLRYVLLPKCITLLSVLVFYEDEPLSAPRTARTGQHDGARGLLRLFTRWILKNSIARICLIYGQNITQKSSAWEGKNGSLVVPRSALCAKRPVEASESELGKFHRYPPL